MKNMKLSDKTTIITGAANGIGLAISKLFTAEGSTVVMADIDTTKCEEEAEAINRSGNGKAIPIFCDVRQTQEVERMVEKTIQFTGSIDVLINNVAVAIGGNVMEMPEENWNTVIDTNLTSVFRCTKAVMPYMVKQKAGSIINMSSTQAHRCWYNWTAYAAAKGAVIALTNQLAGQFAPHNIRVNSISPGTINTPMLSRRMEEEGEAIAKMFIKMHAMERLGRPEEVATVALFLACADSSFVTGQDIIVDGGLTTLPRYDEL